MNKRRRFLVLILVILLLFAFVDMSQKQKSGGRVMGSQIAATPIVRGNMAKKIYDEANQKRNKDEGAKKIKEKFKSKFKDTKS